MKSIDIMVVSFLLMGIILGGCSPSGDIHTIPEEVIKARDWGIEEARKENIDIPQGLSWDAHNITPPLLVGYVRYRFTSGSFRIEVGYPVVLNPVYTVLIYQNGNLVWGGRNWERKSVKRSE